MAGIIRITPEQVRGVARDVDRIAGEAQNSVNTLQQRIESLQSEWEGMTKQRFFEHYATAKKNMSAFIECLRVVSKELESAAMRFEQTDQGGPR